MTKESLLQQKIDDYTGPPDDDEDFDLFKAVQDYKRDKNNKIEGLEVLDIDPVTELNIAAYEGNKEEVIELVGKVSRDALEIALFHSLIKGNIDIVRIFLNNGVSVNATEHSSCHTPLMIAAFHGHFDLVKFLLDRGANPNLINKPKYTKASPPDDWFLRFAGANKKDIKDAKEYFKNLGYENKDAHFRNTALSLAAIHNHSAVVKLLLDRGANPRIKDENGRTVLDYENISDEVRAILRPSYEQSYGAKNKPNYLGKLTFLMSSLGFILSTIALGKFAIKDGLKLTNANQAACLCVAASCVALLLVYGVFSKKKANTNLEHVNHEKVALLCNKASLP